MLKIAIVGRPNVGKSTLFNKLCGRKKAIVHNAPGVTRDAKSTKAKVNDKEFIVVDTAGLEDNSKDAMENMMFDRTMKAIEEADAVFFMMDMSAGVTPDDITFSNMVRKFEKPVLLLANKCDIKKAKENIAEAYSLGLGEPVPLSAEAKLGFYEIEEFIQEWDEKIQKDDDIDESQFKEENKYVKISIIGRPNVGKSTLINSILGEERFITSDFAGTTRDSVEEYFNYEDYRFKIVDTAGVRKKSKTVKENLEQMTVQQTFENIRYSDVVLLIIDGTRKVDKQDLTIADYAVRQGRSLIVAVNKWDLVKDKTETLKEIEEKFQYSFNQVKNLNLLTISALKNKGVDKVLNFIIEMFEMFNRKISTGKLNGWLKDAVSQNPPPLSRLKRPMNLKYITQTASKPPTFTIFSSGATDLPDSYIKYLKNSLVQEFGFEGTPIRFNVKLGDNPYKNKAKKK
ncbi:MAG: ribosome biogenesis GTPase Der [Alphaproteobacteria bacterium]|jgi:GTP-binding protein|nr:ribosome biogenesis GTPase Der [Alphaproteobacteria bacterium]